MRRIFLFTCVLLVLPACGGESATPDTACDTSYWDGTLGTCLPAGWHVVDRATLDQRGLPEDVLVGFQADNSVSGQFPTVTVTRETLATDTSSTEYSDASIESVKGLPAYEEIDTLGVQIEGEDVNLHIFTAKPRQEDPAARFYQLSIADERTGYTYTAAVPVTVENTWDEQIKLILRHATLSDPSATEE